MPTYRPLATEKTVSLTIRIKASAHKALKRWAKVNAVPMADAAGYLLQNAVARGDERVEALVARIDARLIRLDEYMKNRP